VLGVGGSGTVTESQESPTRQESAGHLVTDLRESWGLDLEERFEHGAMAEQFFATTDSKRVSIWKPHRSYRKYPPCVRRFGSVYVR
jgi:hypothetical protein